MLQARHRVNCRKRSTGSIAQLPAMPNAKQARIAPRLFLVTYFRWVNEMIGVYVPSDRRHPTHRAPPGTLPVEGREGGQ
jgi:hypothetical protein